MTSIGLDGLSRGVVEALQRLGLTEYAARCYAALVGMGSVEAAAVADAAEVPRTRVYGVLKDLVDGGWVISEGGRPARYRAAPPDERIPRAEKALAESAAAAVRELQARHQMSAEMMPLSVYVLRGAPAIAKKTLDVVHRAREECFLVLGFLLPGEARELAAAVEGARRRGVRLYVLIGKPPLAGPQPGLEHFRPFFAEARASPLPFRAVVGDFRHAVLVLPQPEATPDTVLGLWNPVEDFLTMLAPTFRGAYAVAAPYE